MSDDLIEELDDVELPEPAPPTIEEDLEDVEVPDAATALEAELDEIDYHEPDGDLLDELADIEVPDPDGTADFEEYSGAFVPGLGDVYAAGGTFVVESIIGSSRGHPGMRLIKTDRGEFAHPTALRVGARYRAVESEGGITLEQVEQSDNGREVTTDE
jgi:hypothetical protein